MNKNEIITSIKSIKYWYHYIYGELELIDIDGDIVKLQPSANNIFYTEYLKLRLRDEKTKDEYLYFNIDAFKNGNRQDKRYSLTPMPSDIAEMFVTAEKNFVYNNDNFYPIDTTPSGMSTQNPQWPKQLVYPETIDYLLDEYGHKRKYKNVKYPDHPLFRNIIKANDMLRYIETSSHMSLCDEDPLCCTNADYIFAIKDKIMDNSNNSQEKFYDFIINRIIDKLRQERIIQIVDKSFNDELNSYVNAFIKQNKHSSYEKITYDNIKKYMDGIPYFYTKLIEKGILICQDQDSYKEFIEKFVKYGNYTKDMLENNDEYFINDFRLRINPHFYLKSGDGAPSYLEMQKEYYINTKNKEFAEKNDMLISNLIKLHDLFTYKKILSK